MTTHNAPSITELEQTAWAKAFKADSPVSYPVALKYAQQNQLEVFVERTTETGESLWAVRVHDDPEFWMEAKPTKAQATAVCRSMGWKIVT